MSFQADSYELVALARQLADLAAVFGDEQLRPRALDGIAGTQTVEGAYEAFVRAVKPSIESVHHDLAHLGLAVNAASVAYLETDHHIAAAADPVQVEMRPRGAESTTG